MQDFKEKKIEIALDSDTVKDVRTLVMFHKIFGMIGIVVGILYTVTVLGAVIGIPYLLISLNFRKAGIFLESALAGGDGGSLGSYFIYQKKSIKIYLIFLVAAIALSFILPFFFVMIGVIIASISQG